MNEDRPVGGYPVVGAVAKIVRRLGREFEQRVARTPDRPLPAPADMTDVQLFKAVYLVGAGLLDGLAPVIQDSFVRWGSAAEMGDPRFPHGMPVTMRGHVLTMTTDAHDAFGLALVGLHKHATAAALGPIRTVAETLAWARWLLEDLDEDVRRARAYRRTMQGIDSYTEAGKALERIAGQSADAEAKWFLAAGQRMKDHLTAMATQDGVTLADKPGSASKLMEQYVPEHGGFLSYAVLSSAGTHPCPARASQFYGTPGAGIDYDFKGKHHVRAYWIAQAILLHLDLCALAAPVLDWGQGWQALGQRTRNRLGPLVDEAERRYGEPLRRAMAGKPDPRGAPPAGDPLS